MNRTLLFTTFALAAASFAACSGADLGPLAPEHTGSASAAVTATSMAIPHPLTFLADGGLAIDQSTGQPLFAWDGSIVDLWAADSWAQCAAGLPTAADQSPQGDSYLNWLQSRMDSMTCTPVMPTSGFTITYPSSTVPTTTGVAGWAEKRLNPACNVGDATGTRVAASYAQAAPPPALPAEDIPYYFANPGARTEVNWAEVNLCMAQHLREYASTGESLTLSALDQRELLEVTRERAQVAMLQYALLGVVFASGPQAAPPTVTIQPYQVEYVLQQWARDASASARGALTTLGQDFAAAVQLHSIVSSELSNLLWRSASARLPRDPTPQSAADEAWGAGSWRQRMLALLYGGDPLVTSTPLGAGPSPLWDHYSGGSNPAAGDVSANTLVPLGWPGKRSDEPGFPSADSSAPEIATLLGLARQDDALYVKASLVQQVQDAGVQCLSCPPAPAYEDVNRPTTATQLYAAVEAHLEADACNSCVSCACACAGDAACLSTCGVNGGADAGSQSGTAGIGTAAVDTACATGFTPSACSVGDAGPTTPAACGVAGFQATLSASAQNLTANYQSTLLWQRYRVTPAHAAALASQLADAIPRVVGTTAATHTASLPGALRLAGAANAYVTNAPSYAGDWYHVNPTATLSDLGLAERAPLFSRLTSLAMPTSIDPAADGLPNGLAVRSGNESARTMGAASALAAVREAVDTALGVYAAPQTGYFQRAQAILDVIDGAIGTTALSTRAATTEVSVASPCPPDTIIFGYPASPCQMYKQTTSGGTSLLWEIGVTLPGDHAFAASPTNPLNTANATYSLVAIPSGMLATALAANAGTPATATNPAIPPTKSFLADSTSLNTIAGLVQSASTANHAVSVPWVNLTIPRGPGASSIYRRWRVWLNGGAGLDPRWSFVLVKTLANVVTYLPLGENVYLHTRTASATPVNGSTTTYSVPAEGQYLPYGGSLGGMARRAWAGTPGNWTRPHFDGYGFASSWVPPTNAAQLGGQSGESASSYYLRSAGAAADEATAAVKSAMDELVAEEQDQATLAAAQQKAAGITQITAQGYCGGASASCDASTVEVTPNLPSVADVTAAFQKFNCQSPNELGDDYVAGCKTAQQLLNKMFSIGASSFSVGKAVADARTLASPPSFSAYSGGTLQSAYIAQWGALKSLEQAGQDALAADVAAWAQARVAYKQQEVLNDQVHWNCDLGSRFKSVLAGISLFAFSLGPMEEWRQKCGDLKIQQADIGDSQAVAAVDEDLSRLAALTTSFMQAAVVLQQASAQGARAGEDARLAVAQANLEASLAADTLVTKFGSYRRYHSYDMWRAKALLESTRRYALTARRAVEAEYVIDMASMTADEPYVAAPATWADEVYQYDLDAPGAVGLSVTPEQAGGIYPNQLTDYIGNINRLVQGYPVARPTAVAKSDSSVISLVGPDQHMTATIGGQPVDVIEGDAARWQFFCPTTGDWRGHPAVSERPAATPLSQVCGTGAPPTRARLAFSLDPWGRVDGNVNSPPFTQQYNARWTQLAVNLVGTGVKDCTRAADPQSCYTQPFVPFNLTHDGPAWVTDYNQVWRSLDIGSGIIEGAKALAAEEWLDPVNDGWSQPYVQSVARSELVERPFGGGYVLELSLAPEVRPEHIASVQILVQSGYWVKQQ